MLSIYTAVFAGVGLASGLSHLAAGRTADAVVDFAVACALIGLSWLFQPKPHPVARAIAVLLREAGHDVDIEGDVLIIEGRRYTVHA